MDVINSKGLLKNSVFHPFNGLVAGNIRKRPLPHGFVQDIQGHHAPNQRMALICNMSGQTRTSFRQARVGRTGTPSEDRLTTHSGLSDAD